MKENFVVSFLSPPARSPAQMVVPEREIPGKTANPCAIPIITAVLVFISPALFTIFFLVKSSVVSNKIAEIIKQYGSNAPPKEDLIIGIKIKTMMQVGIVAKTSVIVFCEKGWRINSHISL